MLYRALAFSAVQQGCIIRQDRPRSHLEYHNRCPRPALLAGEPLVQEEQVRLWAIPCLPRGMVHGNPVPAGDAPAGQRLPRVQIGQTDRVAALGFTMVLRPRMPKQSIAPARLQTQCGGGPTASHRPVRRPPDRRMAPNLKVKSDQQHAVVHLPFWPVPGRPGCADPAAPQLGRLQCRAADVTWGSRLPLRKIRRAWSRTSDRW